MPVDHESGWIQTTHLERRSVQPWRTAGFFFKGGQAWPSSATGSMCPSEPRDIEALSVVIGAAGRPDEKRGDFTLRGPARRGVAIFNINGR